MADPKLKFVPATATEPYKWVDTATDQTAPMPTGPTYDVATGKTLMPDGTDAFPQPAPKPATKSVPDVPGPNEHHYHGTVNQFYGGPVPPINPQVRERPVAAAKTGWIIPALVVLVVGLFAFAAVVFVATHLFSAPTNQLAATNTAGGGTTSPAPLIPLTVWNASGAGISGAPDDVKGLIDNPKVLTDGCACKPAVEAPPAPPPPPKVHKTKTVTTDCDAVCKEYKRLGGTTAPVSTAATPGCVWALQDQPGPMVLRAGLSNTSPVIVESYPTGQWSPWSRDPHLFVKRICPKTEVADRTLCGADGHSSWPSPQVATIIQEGVSEKDPACLLGKDRCAQYGL